MVTLICPQIEVIETLVFDSKNIADLLVSCPNLRKEIKIVRESLIRGGYFIKPKFFSGRIVGFINHYGSICIDEYDIHSLDVSHNRICGFKKELLIIP